MLGIGILAWLISGVGPAGTWDRLADTEWHLLLALFVLAHIGILLPSFAWRTLLETQGHRVPLVRLYLHYVVGSFFNSFLPSNFGGDVARMYALTGDEVEAENAISSTVAERGLGFIALCLLLPASLLSLASSWLRVFLLAVAPITVVLTAAGLVWLTRPLTRDPFVGSSWYRRLGNRVANTVGSIQALRHDPRAVLFAVVAEVLFYVNKAAVLWLAVAAVGLDTSFPSVLAVEPLVILIATIPVTVNGLGLMEGGYVFLLGLIAGIPEQNALAVALIIRSRIVFTAILGGLIFSLHRPYRRSESGETALS